MPYPTYDSGMDYTPPDIPTWDELTDDERAQMLAEEEDFEMEEQQEHWTRQTARSLRFLADKLEGSEGLEVLGNEYSRRMNVPYVMIRLATYEQVDQLAGILGTKAGIGGYQNEDYRAGLTCDSLDVVVKTPVITIPRACEYCDKKHDCTHIDGEVS